MSTVLKPERVRADEIVVGDMVSRTKRGEPEQVIGIVKHEKAVWIHLRMLDQFGRRIGMYRIRPNHETKLWVLR